MTWGKVEHAIPAISAVGTPVYLSVDHESWGNMAKQLDLLNDSNPNEEDLQIIGWYHTHPNQLDVFFSGTDRATQERMFYQDWHFGLVLNPHRKISKVFQGKEAHECSVKLPE